jgi:dynein heavy chain
MGSVQSICTTLDGLLIEHANTINNLYSSKEKEDDLKNIYEAFFIFATMWAWGGSVGGGQDDNEVLAKFSSIWKSLSKIKFPEQGLCYDYYWSLEENKWAPWTAKIATYIPTDEAIFSKIFVSTIHTTRLRYLLNIHLKRKKPVMFVGSAGTGKTQVIKDYLATTKPEQVSHKTINFSSFTDAKALQRNMIAFIDDLNMPYVDKYGTQSPIQLLRQIIDYGSIFNREQLEERKYIQDLLFFACLNHKSGSFTIDLRLQRNFSTFTMYTPTEDIIKTIFGNVLGSHLASPGFDEKIKNISDKIMDATVAFFTRTIKNPQFSPSAKKFHYQFNFRELANIVQGVMRSTPQNYKTPLQIIRLWVHEVRRVFEDRFINDEDTVLFRTFLRDGLVKSFGEINEKENPF